MLFHQARLSYAMCNACIKNVILFMNLHVSRLDTLRLLVVRTVVPTVTCSILLAGDFHGDCSMQNSSREIPRSQGVLSHVG